VPKQQDQKCVVCGFFSEERLCFRHRLAAKSLLEAYSYWRDALGASFRDYLQQILRRSETGRWAKELAEYILKTGDESVLYEASV
jgi:hypothetical protein